MKYATIQDGRATAFYDSDIHAQIPGNAVQITDQQWQEYLCDQGMKRFVNGQVVTRQKSLDELKAEKLAALHVKRLAMAERNILFGGVPVPTDKEAVVLLMASQTYLADKPNKKIKRAGLGELTAAQINALIEAIGQQYDAAFAREADLYAAIVGAGTIDALNAIDIESGW